MCMSNVASAMYNMSTKAVPFLYKTCLIMMILKYKISQLKLFEVLLLLSVSVQQRRSNEETSLQGKLNSKQFDRFRSTCHRSRNISLEYAILTFVQKRQRHGGKVKNKQARRIGSWLRGSKESKMRSTKKERLDCAKIWRILNKDHQMFYEAKGHHRQTDDTVVVVTEPLYEVIFSIINYKFMCEWFTFIVSIVIA